MLSKNQIKFINGLRKKKLRQANQLFLAEGVKVVEELVQSSFTIHKLFFTETYNNPLNLDDFQIITDKELNQISDFTNPNQILAIFEIPLTFEPKRTGLTVLLDNINDPGNLGTIIRLCDWFGVSELVCSENSVDCYNQKVVQASMGSLSRVPITYCNVSTFLKKEKRPVYGTFLNGENVYKIDLDSEAVLVLGNEANGISSEIESLIKKTITIPQFGNQQITESLNVAMATAICLSEFRR